MRTKGKIAASAAALAFTVTLLTGFEGTRLVAYPDVVGVYTVCTGETEGVKRGDRHTQAECDAMLVERIVEFEEAVDSCVFVEVPLVTKISYVSMAYNVGKRAFCTSTLVKKANAGDLRGACDQMPRWNKAGGRIIQGLTNRRVTERELCLSGLSE